MSIFSKIFSRTKENAAPKSQWEQLVEAMHDQQLDCFDGVVEAIYSKDNSRRFVICQGGDGLYRYEYQELRLYTKEEKEFFALMGKDGDACWTIDCTSDDCPGWPTREDARRQLEKEPEYKKYF